MITNNPNGIPKSINIPHKDEKLWEASKKFESMLIANMFKEMQSTIPKSKSNNSGFANDVHSSMFAQAIADQVSKSPTLGIAEAVYRQMSKDNANNIDITKDGTNGKIK